MSIQLRKYQEVVVNNGFAMLREGMNAITFALPVASGKSVIFSSLAILQPTAPSRVLPEIKFILR